MKNGFFPIACATPPLRVADCTYNAEQIISLTREAAKNGSKLVVFPELCITGYTCGDLFLQQILLDGALQALRTILKKTSDLSCICVVGLPIRHAGALYNCAAVCYQGSVLGIVPKQHLPNYGEFYEQRHFTPGIPADGKTFWQADGIAPCPFGAQQLFQCAEAPDFTFGVELCEDVWVADTPSVAMARMGATLIVNLSCSDEIIGKAAYRRTILQAKSGSLFCAYAYADAGMGESTQDMVFAGHNLILENSAILAESKLFSDGLLYAEPDLQRMAAERQRSNSFQPLPLTTVCTRFSMSLTETALHRFFSPTPFVPAGAAELSERCETILTLQATGLATRLRHIGCKTAVVGLSGGLDSTLALIVMVHAFDLLGLPRSGMLAVTMPCFGTTDRTYQNACRLAEAYGATLREIPIQKSVRQHFADIGQDESVHDVTYENSQARERTQVLMDLANQCGGIVVGTGDLSELALGWATYNGDHMSMYAVNTSIPKTLVRSLVNEVGHFMEVDGFVGIAPIIDDIIDTPVSPELLPPNPDGTIAQKTEDTVGSYILHDFFLYYTLRYGMSPEEVNELCKEAVRQSDEYNFSDSEIDKWQKVFYTRFFRQQFKRNCMPDGVKVGTVSVSPRGDLRLPSEIEFEDFL